MGGTYPRGAAVHNFDIGITERDGSVSVGAYDGLPDPAALGPFLVYSGGFYPIAVDMEFTGERDPSGNGSEGVYFLIGGTVRNLPPVGGRLGATGGENLGGIDADNNLSNNVRFGQASGDAFPVQVINSEEGQLFVSDLVDLEPAGNNGFYALDKNGRIYAEGDALEELDAASPPEGMNFSAQAVDLEIYRGRTVDLSNSRYSEDLIGTGAYILDDLGRIYTIGAAPPLNLSDLPILDPDSPFRYRDIEWMPNPAGTQFIGLGALRGDGLIFFAPFEDVETSDEIRDYIQWMNPFGALDRGFTFDIARGFELEIGDAPLYGKNPAGETVATSGRRVGVIMADGFGGLHTGGRSTRYVPAFGLTGPDIRTINGYTAIPYPLNIPYFGVDVIKDIEISPEVHR